MKIYVQKLKQNTTGSTGQQERKHREYEYTQWTGGIEKVEEIIQFRIIRQFVHTNALREHSYTSPDSGMTQVLFIL